VFIYTLYLLCLKVCTEPFQGFWKCSQQGQFKATAIYVAVWGPTLQGAQTSWMYFRYYIWCILYSKLLHYSIRVVNSQLILICKMSNIFLHCPACTVNSKLCVWPINWFVCWTQMCLKPALAVVSGVVQTDD